MGNCTASLPPSGALRNLRITKTTFEKRRCFEQVTRLSCSQCQCFVGFIFYIRLRFVSTVETLSKQIEMDGRALIFIVKIRIEWHGYGHAVSIEMWQIRFIISFLLSHIPYYCVITQYSLLLHNTVWQRSLVVIGWEPITYFLLLCYYTIQFDKDQWLWSMAVIGGERF